MSSPASSRPTFRRASRSRCRARSIRAPFSTRWGPKPCWDRATCCTSRPAPGCRRGCTAPSSPTTKCTRWWITSSRRARPSMSTAYWMPLPRKAASGAWRTAATARPIRSTTRRWRSCSRRGGRRSRWYSAICASATTAPRGSSSRWSAPAWCRPWAPTATAKCWCRPRSEGRRSPLRAGTLSRHAGQTLISFVECPPVIKYRRIALAVMGSILLALALPVRASGLELLHAFIEGTRSARAGFTHTVVARSGRKPQQASGVMMFSRPGKFRWEYDRPYRQLIVGDGDKLWVYDPELKQVTTRKLAEAIGSSPAALLAGDNALDKNFILKDAGSSDGLEWVEAQPKSGETSFESLRLGLAGGM